ncbi:GntT/GntP/DsdX family permease [Nocardioides sambongensis]|uniref:GntT/GntP/DsdX family permease n=1 Tax=Nocardioides sambongensis TaxID=2589074 RepID=UPI0011276886|nr:gluconate:H+ symporter [Nocardioides sambongensis]
MDTQSTGYLVSVAAISVAALLILIIKVKLQPFIALLLTAIAVGFATGFAGEELIELIVDRMGGALGQIAIVIGLGSIFGEVLRQAGAAEKLASTIIDRFSERTLSFGLGLAGFLVSIAVFIDVAIVILVPMLYPIARRTGKSLLFYAIPLCAGLSVTHTFIPPTPGPIATASILGVDLGWMILFGVIAGLPAMIIAGPVFGRWISKRLHVVPPASDAPEMDASKLPSLTAVIATLLLPLVLILSSTTADLTLAEGSNIRSVLMFIGHPVIALMITTLFTLWYFGTRRGFSAQELQDLSTKALAPAGVIILITGAGGVFGGVLVAAGVGDVIAEQMSAWSIPLILFGFLIALLMRIAQGSGTVAMITGATFTAPVAENLGASQPLLALTAISIASGAAAASHVNDTGFWMANRYLGMSVADTLKSWTVMKTIVGVVGVSMCLLMSLFV